ncbi:hypothetical protein PIB30_046541 [Stylosanthes scabra]|uniref:Uncharacterized protein n=1 Tax=Stylosanthes scabra TaxID=79078 RepID=A0ABU6TGW1_9FABA|nr:hypothetical protein [Stylosanthes scabra]
MELIFGCRFETDPFIHKNGVEFVATAETLTQDPTSPPTSLRKLQNYSINELSRAIEGLRRDVKEFIELKKSVDELIKSSGIMERSLKRVEFKLFKNEDTCKDHEEFNANFVTKGSLSGLIFHERSARDVATRFIRDSLIF